MFGHTGSESLGGELYRVEHPRSINCPSRLLPPLRRHSRLCHLFLQETSYGRLEVHTRGAPLPSLEGVTLPPGKSGDVAVAAFWWLPHPFPVPSSRGPELLLIISKHLVTSHQRFPGGGSVQSLFSSTYTWKHATIWLNFHVYSVQALEALIDAFMEQLHRCVYIYL